MNGRAIFVFKIGFCFLVGCSEVSRPKQDSSENSVLRWAVSKVPLDVYPGISDSLSYRRHLGLVSEGVARANLTDSGYEITPALADTWQWEDSRHLRIVFKRGLHWSDGKEFSADQWVSSLQRNASICRKFKEGSLFYFIQNGREICQRRVPMKKLGVKKVDSQTVVIEWSRTSPLSLWLLAHPLFWPSRSDATLGPYVLRRRETNTVVYVPNPYYLGSLSSFAEIQLIQVENLADRIQMFEEEEVDLVEGDEGRNHFPERLGSLVVDYPSNHVVVLEFNQMHRPLYWRGVRQALQRAISTDDLALALTERSFSRGRLLFMDSQKEVPTTSLPELEKLLEGVRWEPVTRTPWAAGFWRHSPHLIMQVGNDAALREVFFNIQAQWASKLGVMVDESTSSRAHVRIVRWDTSPLGLFQTIPTLFANPEGSFSHWRSPEAELLFQQASATNLYSESLALLQNLEEKSAEDEAVFTVRDRENVPVLQREFVRGLSRGVFVPWDLRHGVASLN